MLVCQSEFQERRDLDMMSFGYLFAVNRTDMLFLITFKLAKMFNKLKLMVLLVVAFIFSD